MSWRTSAAVAVVAALVAPASGGASAGAVIPRATYVKRADALCLDVARKAVALRSEAQRRIADASSADEVLRIFGEIYRRQLVLIQSMRRRIVAIGTPRGAAATARALVAGIRAGERALQQVITAIENGSVAEMTRAVNRYRDISLTSARAVKRSSLGFKACGAGA